MKDFAVRLRIYNNQIRARRESLGISQADAAKRCGISYHTWMRYEGLKESPIVKNDYVWGRAGDWTRSALKMAAFFGVDPIVIFPDVIRTIVETEITATFDVEELRLAEIVMPPSLPPSPEEALEEKDLHQSVEKVLRTLSVREEAVLRSRFGIGVEDKTLEELAVENGVTRERIRQIETKALKKLRHPSRSSLLRQPPPPRNRYKEAEELRDRIAAELGVGPPFYAGYVLALAEELGEHGSTDDIYDRVMRDCARNPSYRRYYINKVRSLLYK